MSAEVGPRDTGEPGGEPRPGVERPAGAEWAVRGIAALRRLEPSIPWARRTVPPAPTVEMALASPVPGALVRLVPAVLVLVCAALTDVPYLWILLVPLAVAVAVRPASPAPAAAVAVIGIGVLAGGDLLAADGGSATAGLARMSGLVLGVHLVVRGAALASHVAWRGVVEGPVLARVARSVLGAQLVAQGLVLAVVWLRAGLGGVVAGATWLRLVAVLAVLVVALLVVPRSWLERRPVR